MTTTSPEDPAIAAVGLGGRGRSAPRARDRRAKADRQRLASDQDVARVMGALPDLRRRLFR
jgi:hypothetical protein